MARIVYHPRYDISFFGLERLHPFDSRKAGRALACLRQTHGAALTKALRRVDRSAKRVELLEVHTEAYLDRLNSSAYVAQALELPIVAHLPNAIVHWRVLTPMRWATRGTVLACEEALHAGVAANLAGGYHHAKPASGEGFCIYSDIALAVHALRNVGLLGHDRRVAYIDLDAHQGNGVCHQFIADRRVFIYDQYNARIYPAHDAEARERIDCNVPLTSACTETEYLGALHERLPPFLDSIHRNGEVGLAIYNAGTDVFEGDPLGGLHLSAGGVLERDRFVITQSRERGIPIVLLPSGGYTQESHRLIAETLGWMLTL